MARYDVHRRGEPAAAGMKVAVQRAAAIFLLGWSAVALSCCDRGAETAASSPARGPAAAGASPASGSTIKPDAAQAQRIGDAKKMLRDYRAQRRLEAKEQTEANQADRMRHGPDATLTPTGHLSSDLSSATPNYPLLTPDWNAARPLSYLALHQLFGAMKQKKRFPAKAVGELHGAAVVIAGAVIPIDPPGKNAELKRFWLANPQVVMAGCVFCNPPTLGDLVYVDAGAKPLKVDREALYRSVVLLKVTGRLRLGPFPLADGIETVFKLDMHSFET